MVMSALLCLAMNVFYESRGEPEMGQMAVALVTVNRTQTEGYPKSVCKVVYQKGQFAWTRNHYRMPKPTDPAWIKANDIATQVLSGNIPDFTSGSIFFRERSVHPYWPHAEKVVTIGHHVFYRQVVLSVK